MSGRAERTDRRDAAGAAMVLEAIDDGLAALGELAAGSTALAAACRRFEIAGAHAGLLALSQNLDSLLVLTGTVRAALAPSGAAGPAGDETTTGLRAFEATLEALLLAATGADWIQVADLLEYDLPVMLERWRGVLETLRAQAAAPCR